jgi:cytoskeletal protein CcmA (bactofilin family)
MLGSKKSARGVAGATTLISRETRIVGDIHFSGNLDIEGVVEGNVTSRPGEDAFLRVVENGCIHGDLRAPAVVINGTVEGDVYASESLELAPHARVQGNVMYKLVEMSVGAEVNGSLKHVADAGASDASREEGSEARPDSEVVAPMKRTGGTPGKS